MDATGWTGGQYSLFRVLFGAWLFLHFCGVLGSGLTAPDAVPTGIAVACCLLFGLGLGDRAAALTLAAAGILLHSLWLPAVPLLFHCFVPAAPYGSWPARSRSDPAGNWALPQGLRFGAIAALALGYVALLIDLLAGLDLEGAVPGLLALHVLAFDPGWIRRPHSPGPDRVFYDGSCGLCHQAVRFLIAEDRAGSAFRFAPLQSRTFHGLVAGDLRSDLPDSIVVVTPGGAMLTRAAAILHCARRLGGLWRLLADSAAALPLTVLNRLYDTIAQNRYKLFPKPAEACPLMPERLRTRFDS